MDYGFENFKIYNLYEKGQFVKNVKVLDGIKTKVPVVVENDLLYPLREDELDKIVFNIYVKESIKAPVGKGDVLGYIEVFLDGKLISKDKLIAKYNIEEKSFIKRLFPLIYKR